MSLVHMDREPKHRSSKDVKDIITILVRTGIRECQSYSSLCHSWMRQVDVFGRTALHLAASFGKLDTLEWLLEERKADLNQRDLESGYTALHRALFYGQLGCARLLTQFNCDMQVRDIEGLSPLDMPMMDRPSNVTYSLKEPNEVYTWGEDHNSTLGHAISHERLSPEAVDIFKKSGVSIKQVVLCKYHSVFLSQSGRVYTCGHGHGGRLGHQDQKTILVPRLLESVQEHTCLEVAAACDHTALRMAGGLVYSFGLNAHHQLGLTPIVESSPIPKLMNLKPLKGKSISGVCVGRFHTVIWTPDSVFTVGLNAGQLGHQRGDKTQSVLREVSYMRHTDIGLARVACSDAATVCLTTKGDVYILHEYLCKKIASKWQDIEQVLVTGGSLDDAVVMEMLKETQVETQELRVLMKNESGQLFLWRNSSPSLKRCRFGVKRQLWISEVAMTSTTMLLATERGEAFTGSIPAKRPPSVVKDSDLKYSKDHIKDCGDGFNQPRLLDLLLKDEMEEIPVKRVPYVHRAVYVAMDKEGWDFAVVQALPNGCLTEFPMVTSSEINEQFRRLHDEADVEDNIHDAVIQVGNRSWPVHRYIISLRSDYFRNAVTASQGAKGEPMVLRVDNVSCEIMEQLILFIYTDSCDYLQLGHKIVQASTVKNTSFDGTKHSHILNYVAEEVTKGLSAYQVHQKSSGKANKPSKPGVSDGKDDCQQSPSPVKVLQEAARRFGVKGLSQRLDAVKYSNGVIISQAKNLVRPKVTFDRAKLPELYDVNISSSDGQDIQCHKCVLVARLEYFYSMLSTGWVETFNTTNLSLPIPGQVLIILIDYLYCDNAPRLKDCVDEELLCSVLIMSDQLLASRLKEMCEVALANTITFKNVGDLLEFSTIYNAQQLRVACQQFISLNLPAVLEGKFLDVLSDDTMEDLTIYYRSIIPNMAYRVLTPDNGGPYQDYIDEVLVEWEAMERGNGPSEMIGSAKKATQPKKAKAKVKKSAEDKGRQASKEATSPRSTAAKACPVSSAADDVKAVAEELEKQTLEDDKKLQSALAARNKEKMRWKLLTLQEEKLPPTLSAPTQPEAVPHWNGHMKTLSKSPGQLMGLPLLAESTKATPMVSPESPPLATSPTTSLREIMSQESQAIEKSKSNFASRISWKDVKKQQSKEMKQQKQGQPDPSIKPGPPLPSPKATSNPWAPVSSAAKPLRDLMIQEEKRVSSPVPIPAGKKEGHSNDTSGKRHFSETSSVGSLGSLGISPRSPGRDITAAGKGGGGDNPWTRRITMAASPPVPSPAAINFSAILRDEKEKSETLVRIKQKPLALIQLEERAMNELLQHYLTGQDNDTYVTVERVSKAMAVPLWHRESKPVGHQL